LIDVGNDIIAFDLVDIEDIDSDQVLIEPTSKSNVTKDGEIVGEGKVVAQYRSGLLRVVARAINIRRHPHEVDRLSRGNANRRRLAGEIAVFNGPALGFADREITDLDLKTGSILTKRRRRYF
jgi:ABC-type lipoprotein export system ATPase subunit